ncbi:MAG: hypothetical protein EBW38_19125, partial [Rhodobacteraceae bacterium]|nr:hypothetical protein [Paracoccaceae bacterium]
SKIVLERLDTRYVVAERRVLHASRIMLTPYAEKNTIDAKALGDFIQQCHSEAGISPDEIDTGALILTGVAARRSNAPIPSPARSRRITSSLLIRPVCWRIISPINFVDVGKISAKAGFDAGRLIETGAAG